MEPLLQDLTAQIVAAVLAALAAFTLLDDVLADAAARLPYVGRFASPVVRRLSARFRQWMGERVPAQADRVVRQTEAAYGPLKGASKLALAARALSATEPGLTEQEATVAVQAAVDRAKATPALSDASARFDELEAALTASPGALTLDARAPRE
jgi:hypothetical protein